MEDVKFRYLTLQLVSGFASQVISDDQQYSTIEALQTIVDASNHLAFDPYLHQDSTSGMVTLLGLSQEDIEQTIVQETSIYPSKVAELPVVRQELQNQMEHLLLDQCQSISQLYNANSVSQLRKFVREDKQNSEQWPVKLIMMQIAERKLWNVWSKVAQ